MELSETTILVITWLVGFVGVPLISLLKKWLNVEDVAAFWLTILVAILLGIAALFVTGGFGLPTTIDEVVALGSIILAASQVAYRLLVKKS